MRQRVQQSPLCDPKLFTKHIENAFSNMWEDARKENASAQNYPSASDMVSVFQSKDLEKAASLAFRALEKNPDSFGLRHLIGKLFFGHRSFERALAVLKSAEELADTHAVTQVDATFLVDLGNAYVACSASEEAEKYYEKALLLDESFREGLINLGLCKARKGELEAAKDLYHRALRVSPEDCVALTNYATLFFEVGNYQRGLRCSMKCNKETLAT